MLIRAHLHAGHMAVQQRVVDLQAGMAGRQDQVPCGAQQLPGSLLDAQPPGYGLHPLDCALHLPGGNVDLRRELVQELEMCSMHHIPSAGL